MMYISPYPVPVMIIDKQPPKTLHGYKSGRIILECSAHCSRESIGEIEYQWFKNKTGLLTCTIISWGSLSYTPSPPSLLPSFSPSLYYIRIHHTIQLSAGKHLGSMRVLWGVVHLLPLTFSYHCQVSVRGRTDLLPMKSTITSVTVNCSEWLEELC